MNAATLDLFIVLALVAGACFIGRGVLWVWAIDRLDQEQQQ